MGKQEKRAYFLAIWSRYKTSSKVEKQVILNEFCAVCGYARKYAIRLLNQKKKAKTKASQEKKQAGPRTQYGEADFFQVLKTIWFATDQMCGKRLKAAIPHWLPYYEASHHPITEKIRCALLKISAATLDRLLKPLRVQNPKGLSGTRPGSLLKTQIPIRTHHWDETLPGFMEADTVAHCGQSLAGDFVWSLTMTDIISGWTENRATWNKGSAGVIDQIKSIEQSLPFPLRGFDCDNGSEFLNHHLLQYFTDHPKKPAFTRSRPYKKNDNAYVEQKNWTHARQLFGYDRLDKPHLVAQMNDIYATLWCPLQNHFCPNMKLKTKHRHGAKYRRKHDFAQTPYQRLMTHPYLDDTAKHTLKAQHDSLNPFALRNEIERQLRLLFKSVPVTSNVRQRL